MLNPGETPSADASDDSGRAGALGVYPAGAAGAVCSSPRTELAAEECSAGGASTEVCSADGASADEYPAGGDSIELCSAGGASGAGVDVEAGTGITDTIGTVRVTVGDSESHAGQTATVVVKPAGTSAVEPGTDSAPGVVTTVAV